MAEGKDTRSFFRKVVSFVVSPGADEPVRSTDSDRESAFAKSELKAMIERKRRNDFVRKRELDMLRKLRRQGLTPEQLAALGSSSGMADTESSKAGDTELPPPTSMRAKIDEIEEQMAGQAIPTASRRPSGPPPTLPSQATPGPGRSDHARSEPVAAGANDLGAEARSVADTIIEGAELEGLPGLDVTPSPGPAAGRPSHGHATAAAPKPPGLPVGQAFVPLHDSQSPSAMEVSEAVHDPDLDEAVMSYANGDNDLAEQLLLAQIRPGGRRAQSPDTWMVVFDLYRATGQQARFDLLASEFAERFSCSAPQWFSMPKLIADARTVSRPKTHRIDGRVGWVCPPRLDVAAVDQLTKRVLAIPLPWVFDWSALSQLDADACAPLTQLFRHWAPQPLDMRWIGGEQLLNLLAEAAPVGVRDAAPALWQLRLQFLRLCNRPDRFDEVAIDYCVTYEVSPPSWEPAQCQVRISGPAGAPTNVAPLTQVGEASTSFVESQLADEPGLVQMVRLELSGQLAGDIGPVVRRLDQQLGEAKVIEVSCARLLRVDFMASGDLLNWVLTCHRAGRSVSFVDTNRLVALFFSAIGIDAHAVVKVRKV